jgi:hypothetical protein
MSVRILNTQASVTANSNVLIFNRATNELKVGDQIIHSTISSNVFVKEIKSDYKIIASNIFTSNVSGESFGFARDDEQSKLVKFLDAYNKFLESTGNAQEVFQNIQLYKDVDTTIDSLLEQFYKNFAYNISRNLLTEKRTFIKRVKDVYKRIGTEEALKIMFRALYGEEIQIIYPEDRVLKASDGKWIKDASIKVKDTTIYSPFNFENTIINGQTSGASAVVSRVLQQNFNGIIFYELILDQNTIKGKFSHSEIITARKLLAPSTIINFTSFADLILESYASIGRVGIGPGINQIDQAGYNYWLNQLETGALTIEQFRIAFQNSVDTYMATYPNDAYTIYIQNYINNNNLSNVITITGATLPSISGIDIISCGPGYTANNTITISSPTGEFAIAKVYELNNVGVLKKIEMQESGVNYFASNTLVTIDSPKNILQGNILVVPYNASTNIATFTGPSENGLRVNDRCNIQISTGNVAVKVKTILNTIQFRFDTGVPVGVYNANLIYDNTAVLRPNIAALKISEGYWKNSKGKLSEKTFLRGSSSDLYQFPAYYQPYSYVIRTNNSIENWESLVRNTTHPAGTELFGEIFITSELKSNVSVDSVDSEIWNYIGITVDKTNIKSDLTIISGTNLVAFPLTSDHVFLLFNYL